MTNEQIEQAAGLFATLYENEYTAVKDGFIGGAKSVTGGYGYLQYLISGKKVTWPVTEWMPIPEPPDDKEVTEPTKCNCPDDQCLLGNHPTCRLKDLTILNSV